jgi:hypothetical protein
MEGFMYNKDGKLINNIKDIVKQKEKMSKVVFREETEDNTYELVVDISKLGFKVITAVKNNTKSPIDILKRALKEFVDNKYLSEKTALRILKTEDEEIIALLGNLESFVENGYKLIGAREYVINQWKEQLTEITKSTYILGEGIGRSFKNIAKQSKKSNSINIPSGISIEENVAEVDLEKIKQLIDEQVNKVKNEVTQILER